LQSKVGSRAFQNARLQKQFKKEAEGLLLSAVAAYRAGRLADVRTLCTGIIEHLPDHFDALRLLGVCELDSGRFVEAEQVLRRAVAVNRRSAEAHCNLGLALFKLKRYDEARKCQEEAVALQPNFPTALTNLGNVLLRLGRFAEAVEAHDRALRFKPDYADAYCNRGMAQLQLNHNVEAGQSFDRAISLRPRNMPAFIGKALASMNLRHFEAARAALDAASAIDPNAAEVLARRGWLSVQLRDTAAADRDFDAALAVDPDLEAAWRGKAQIAVLNGNTAQALAACNKVLEQNPVCDATITMLGTCYAKQGEISAAIAHFDRALAIRPDHEDAISRKIFVLDFAEDADFAVHQAARRAWWEGIGAKIPRRDLCHVDADPDRRIVVGYVSSDFRDHSAALTFKPMVRHHDRANFEVVCYSCSPKQDAVTEEFRSLSDRFVDALQMSDDELADRIQADNIDILVDLSGHTSGNRLMMFARKPAPVQVSACGSVTGTGLPTIDCVLADPVTIPHEARHLFAERVIFDLPALITMEGIAEPRPAVELPMFRSGHVTFGVFNRIDKISDHAIQVWSRLLQAVDGSTITVKHGALDDPFLRNALIARFVAQGIAQDRITCVGATTRRDHLAAFADIDIALDPFPQNGGVSTWEALHMGVPVVAKLGNSCSSRAGAAIVKAIGLDDWVADDDDRYVAIAQHYASMPSHLQALREGLPDRIARSDAGNGEIYTRHVEACYRKLWHHYCASLSAAG
jgi:predicted O-linked N-acetylglucosamine transferase (SPINDLY family)